MISKLKHYISDDLFKMILFDDKVYVVNYLEIITLDINKVSFLIPNGKLYIKGKNLYLKRLLDKEILIIGNVINIEVDKNGE